MNLQNKLAMQEQELYIYEISKGEMEDMAQDENRGNVGAMRSAEPVSMDVVPAFAISIVEAKARIAMLQEFVRDMMVEGSDFGFIPGCGSKPTLLKPGAEKLCDIFGFAKYIEVTNRLEEWDKGIFAYEVKAVLTNKRTGLVEAEGIGCCNSREKKYKQQDSYTIVNTILKIAKKRALVDAVLSATRSSGLFTQDIEDMQIIDVIPDRPVQSEPIPEAPHNNHVKMASQKQLNKLYYMTKQMNMDGTAARQLMMDRYNVDSSEKLTGKEASDFIDHLNLLLR